MLVLKAGAVRRVGSSPSLDTKCLLIWPSGVMAATPVLGTGTVRCAGSSPVSATSFYLLIRIDRSKKYGNLLSKSKWWNRQTQQT